MKKTLRDEIAIATMQGLISSRDNDTLLIMEDVAKASYDMADAMLAEKQRREQGDE